MACSRTRRDKQCAALLLVDLDSFKAINDNLGHAAGDHCPREVANRMLTQLQPTDTVARIGGDELLIVLDRISDAAQVSSIAGQIIDAVARPIEFGDRQFSTSASVGIAIYPDHAPLEELLRQRADAAMYVAKRSGKNQFEFAGLVPTS